MELNHRQRVGKVVSLLITTRAVHTHALMLRGVDGMNNLCTQEMKVTLAYMCTR
jgi:hypothetical protein